MEELEKMWQEKLVDDLFRVSMEVSQHETEETRSNIEHLTQFFDNADFLNSEDEEGTSEGDKVMHSTQGLKIYPQQNEEDHHKLKSEPPKVDKTLNRNSNTNDEILVLSEYEQISSELNQHNSVGDESHGDLMTNKEEEVKQQVNPVEDSEQRNRESEVQKKDVPKKPKMVFVLTQSRHGSTWLMDMLGFREDAVPVFEPLNISGFLKMYAQSEDIRNEALAAGFDPVKYYDWREVYLARICLCDWHGTKISEKQPDRHFGSILGLWYKEKRKDPKAGGHYDIKPAMDTCFKEGSLMVPKTIRYYNMSTLYRIADFGCDNFKVIHLVRDPRAVMNSRMSVFHELYDGSKLLGPHIDGKEGQAGFDTDYMEKAADWMCSHHLYNYKLGINPPPWLVGRYKMVRYEDLAASPDYWTREILHFIGLKYTKKYKEYVYNITHIKERGEKDRGTYSVEKETSEMIDKWKAKLTEPHWRTIERVCADMMRVFNYEPTFTDPDN